MKQSDIASRTWAVTPDLLGFLSKEGRFVATNPAWTTLLGYSHDEIAAQPFFDLVHPDDQPETQAVFERIGRGLPALNFVNRYRRKDGGYEWLSWNAVPEEDLCFCSARCITEDMENRAALKTSEDEAALREQFIAVLSHDVRNPLAAINAAARQIRRASDDAKITEMIASIEGSSGRIARLIDDVMDFARARLGGGLVLASYDDHDVEPILKQVAKEIDLAHPGAVIETQYDFCDPIRCDSGRIGQLISNLLANAVTHGEKGAPITMHAWDEDGAFNLTVANGGDPIPEEARKMLFHPFSRGSVRSSQQGLGLGLFISREIARAHGGELTMTSDDDSTIFAFWMPRH